MVVGLLDTVTGELRLCWRWWGLRLKGRAIAGVGVEDGGVVRLLVGADGADVGLMKDESGVMGWWWMMVMMMMGDGVMKRRGGGAVGDGEMKGNEKKMGKAETWG